MIRKNPYYNFKYLQTYRGDIMKKFYIRINGELMEVDYKVYREYYYGKRKEKYFMFDLKWGGIKQKGAFLLSNK